MTKVLIALDYDPTARLVAEIGFLMGKAMHAEITLLHVVPDPVYYAAAIYNPIMGFGGYMGMDFMEADAVTKIKAASTEYLQKTKFYLGDTALRIMVKEGEVRPAILQAAQEINAGVIAMGSHSRRWMDTILMGSVAESVLRHTTVPVFIIPTQRHK
jgi:nucleotide-binding universal stress UspA family protein